MYRLRDYWTYRALVAGKNYVGPGSHADLTEAQGEEFEEALRGRLGRSRLLLDFGCGSGRFSRYLSSFTEAYLGVDISSVGIDQARRAEPDLHFLWLPLDRIELPKGVVDTVVAITVLQHIVAPGDLAVWGREIRRVLRPGRGRVYVIEQKAYVDEEPHEHVAPRIPEDLGDALGLKIRKVESLSEHWLGVYR